jgi:hypothetical protein
MQTKQARRADWIPADDHEQFGAVKGTLASVILGVAVWPVIILAISRAIS